MCLMVGSMCSESSAISFEDESIDDRYYQLLNAFQELHEEARKMKYLNNKLKSEKTFLEARLENLDKENENLKSKLESLKNAPRQSIKKSKVSVQ